ncbi:MAG: S46 family peptidase [Prevotellaceae bacterium]|nr:S46 family peptidase [Prevotellaceae bacterium]
MKKILIVLCFAIISPTMLLADEGMWLPMLLKKYNEKDMQKKGFRLTAEDLYSVNKASLKDAIVQFGGGCTGELVSAEGLLLTNHHCGYRQIQSHSSLENNYLEYGFWAKTRSEELPNPGLTVKFLVRMNDVTDRILEGITDQTPEDERIKLVNERSKAVAKESETEKGYTSIVKPIYYGNQYILYVYEEFTDVRLVGTPPDAIGKFGGDSDNWMWPRHTGDFSVFRIYAGKDNKPASYSTDNVPYKPKKYFHISLKGVNQNDFTFIYGFPGTTQEYIPSYAVEMLMQHNPHKIALRDQRLDIINADMAKDESTRIKYASKQNSIANAWKKWQGELKGLDRLNAVQKKQAEEQQFISWTSQNAERTTRYGKVLNQLKDVYANMNEVSLVNDYYREAIMGVELLKFCSDLAKIIDKKQLPEELIKQAERLTGYTTSNFFKDYIQSIDKRVFTAMFSSYHKNIAKPYHPEYYTLLYTECGNSIDRLADKVFRETKLLDEEYLTKLLNNKDATLILNSIRTDIAYRLFSSFNQMMKDKVDEVLKSHKNKANLLQRTYMSGLMEMEPNKSFYPDANSTLRVAYGYVDGFYPTDGVRYKHYTTLDGVIEKAMLPADDYRIPEKLKQLHANRDYGRYTNTKGELPVGFIATNHTTGGNSGSPILNGTGELVGINFDRCWESTMSDIMFDPDYCRNISVDIRYVLFVIDKYAGAKHLIDEMTIAK